MLIHSINVQNCGQTNMRNHQFAIILHGVHEIFIKWFLLPQFHQIGHFFAIWYFWHCVAWFDYFFLKTLNNSNDKFGIWSQSENDHIFVEILDSQIFAAFFLAPVFEEMG